MTRRGNKTEQQELLVYLAECPDHGPEHRTFDDQDICVAGGVRALEAELERETDRFVRLDVIKAKKSATGTTFKDKDIAALPTPLEHDWQIGRLSPAYRRSQLEREIYMSEVRAAQSLLARWKYQEDQKERMDVSFVPKRIRVGCLASLASSLCALGEAFDTVRMTVIKYCDDPNSKITPPIDLPDCTISDFALTVPIRVSWGCGDYLVVSDVMPFLYC